LLGAVAIMSSVSAIAAPVLDDITLQDVVASGVVQKCSSGANCVGGFGTYSYSNEPTFEGYYDTPTVGPAWATGKSFRWGDVIGNPAHFELESLRIIKTADSISFIQKTKFDGAESGAYTSHMFIDTLTPLLPDTFNLALVLGTDQAGGSGLNLRSGGMAVSGLYQVGTYKEPADIWSSGGWGGLIQFCKDVASDPGTCDATDSTGFSLEPPVLLATGTKIGEVAWTRTNGGDGWYYLKAVVTGVDMNLFNQFDILATVADCANDALWGTVTTTTTSAPAPGAVFLLGLGLIGIGFVRRRAA
jgi:hypothetical protein